jgi:hypothetical protein
VKFYVIGVVGSAFAFTKSNDIATNRILNFDWKDKSDCQKSDSTNAGDSNSATGDTSGISAKDLKSLSKCQADDAEDSHLTQSEVTNCYRQVF